MSKIQEQDVYTFPNHPSGATLKSRTFVVEVNGDPPASALSAVSIKFAKDGATTLTLANGSGVTITDAANWNFTVGPVAAATMAIAEGIHEGDCKLTAANGTVTKWARFKLPILKSET